MHIREVDEHLDYELFYRNHQTRETAGPITWELWQGTADHFPCGHCRPGAQAIAHGGHDMVNLLKGRRAQTPQHFELLHDLVNAAWDIYTGKVICHSGNCLAAKRSIPIEAHHHGHV